MKHEKLHQALNEISDRHIAEAATKQKRRTFRWIAPVAAALAVVILATAILRPFTLSARAVSLADYPKYSWQYRGDAMDRTLPLLTDFFTESMSQTLSGSQENQTYSPINLYMALCLMAETCDSNDQILSLLHTDNREELRDQANLIWNACYRDDGDQTLLANSVWLDQGLEYNQTVMDTLAENYYTSVYKSDLQSNATGKAIKKWLNSQTGNMLKSDVSKLQVDPLTVMLLYSTVYYQAKWTDESEFQKARNTEGIFHTPTGDVTCTYMNKKEMQTYYYWGAEFGAVGLGLKDGSRMWLLLPDESKTTDDVLASRDFSSLLFAENYGNAKYMKVNLSLPKFDIRAAGDLRSDLEALGVTDVFHAETADFSGTIYNDIPLWFDAVNQATRVAIDEKGVTAASYIELPTAGAAPPPEEVIDFVLDRPFVFVITNRYDLPLFAGVVNMP